MMHLYDYYRSSCSYRVRIALLWKAIPFDKIAINLLSQEQQKPDYRMLNPQALVPTLVDQGQCITQSLAILEYLDETHPNPPLLPGDPSMRSEIRSLALLIACDIHPVNNLRVLNELRQTWNAQPEQLTQWYQHWLAEGFQAIEKKLSAYSRQQAFCYTDQVTMADLCLIPQVYNALRYELSLEPYPIIQSIYKNCLTIPAFIEAQP